MTRGMTDMPTKWQLVKYWVKAKLCFSGCKYSSYHGLVMCQRHSKNDWIKYEEMHPELKKNYDAYLKELKHK